MILIPVKVILDTNCFLSCIGKKSSFRNIFDAFLKEEYTLCVSSEILLEYEEKFQEFWGEEVSSNLLGVLLTSSNISFHHVYFNFKLVKGDADDNKFVDAFITSSADFLISNDIKLLAVNEVKFPAITVMNIQDFSLYLKKRLKK